MKRLAGLAMAALLLSGSVQAGEAGDALIEHLYAGTAAQGLADAGKAL
jgi:outer membrane lipoprotein-sorting protein